jgi:hypothetical protein
MTRYCNLVGFVPVKAMAYEDVEFYHVIVIVIYHVPPNHGKSTRVYTYLQLGFLPLPFSRNKQ